MCTWWRWSALALTSAILAACGGSASDDDDDVEPDAAAAVGSITVHVRTVDGYEQPAPDAEVFFTRADGTLIGSAIPDSLGLATGQVTDGGSVTVHYGGSDRLKWFTVTDVSIGDELWFGLAATRSRQGMTISYPAAAGATMYRAQGPCLLGLSSGTTQMINLVTGCDDPRPLLLTTNTGTQPHQHLLTSITPAVGSTLAITGTWVDEVTVTATVAGVPAGAGALYATASPTFEHQRGASFDVAIAGTPPTLTFPFPPTDPSIGVELLVTYNAPTWFSSTTHLPSLPPSPIALDVAPFIPLVATRLDDATGISWTTTGSGAADAIVVEARAPANGLDEHVWTFVTPATATRVDYPQIPTIPAGLRATSVAIHGNDVTTRWDDVRPRAGYRWWAGLTPSDAPGTFVAQQSNLR